MAILSCLKCVAYLRLKAIAAYSTTLADNWWAVTARKQPVYRILQHATLENVKYKILNK